MKKKDSLLTKTQEAVFEAGQIIRKNWSCPKNIKYKGRIDLVTETDPLVEKKLKKSLSTIMPPATFLAEETDNKTPLGEWTWIIDPLDGTTNFAHQLFSIAVSVALWHESHIELGIVYLPLLDEMFWAKLGQGAHLNGEPITVSEETDLEKSLIATGFPYDVQQRINEVIPPFQNVLYYCQGVRRLGAAAVDLAYTACGRFSGFYELGLKPWDTAAGCLLVQEAGGKVTTFDPDQPYFLGSDSILASNGKIHTRLANLLSQDNQQKGTS